MRLPKIFSRQNNTRHYKISIKGTTGVLIFTELVKKSITTQLLIKNLKKADMDESLESKIDLEKQWVITNSSLLKMFTGMFKEYVNQVRERLLKKNITIVNWKTSKIIIKPADEKSLQVDSYLDIEVAV